MIELFANNASTILSSSVSNVATVITLNPGAGALFPNPSAGQYFRLSFTSATIPGLTEITWCTARTGDVCTIIRAQEGTTAQSWNAGDNVANFNTAGTSANFVQKQQMQQNLYNYAADTGTANNYIVNLTPSSLSIPVLGALVYMRASNSNTGPSTITINGGTSYPIYGQGGVALQGGEIVAGGNYCLTFNSAQSAYILTSSSGGALQIGAALHSSQAINLGQMLSSIATNGYVKIPTNNGGTTITLIIQWGTFVTSGGSYQAVSYPIPFPTGPLTVVGTYQNNLAGLAGFMYNNPDSTGFNAAVINTAGAYVTGGTVTWIAVGR